MRILIPVFGFARAGGGRVLSKFATEWVELGHQVSFLCQEGYGPVYFPTDASVIWFNAAGEIVDVPNHQAKKLSYFGVTIWLTKLIKKIAPQYDIVLANHAPTVMPAWLAGVQKKIFYYIQAYEPEYLFSYPSLKYKVKGVAAWLTYFQVPRSRCIVNSDIYVNYKNIRACDEVIPPGIDTSVYWCKKFRGLANRKIVLGTIGRTEPYKGTHDVIRAYRLLRERGINVSLKIAYGNVPNDLLEGLEDVEVTLPKNDQELSDFYRSVDVLLALGTVQLGAPHYPVIEAMACGTLVVTTGYYPANQDNAYIVPIGGVEATAKAVIKIIGNDESKLLDKVRLGLEKINVMTWPHLAGKMLAYMKHTL